MKKLIMLLCLPLFMMVGCKKEESSRIGQSWITGKWLLVNKTGSSFSNNVELNFDEEPDGTYVDINGNTWKFTYSLTTMIFRDVQNNSWKINKISENEISFGATTATRYKKQ